MRFPIAKARSVRADIAAKKITLSFTVDLSELDQAEQLAAYCEEDAGDVALEITPRQPPLFKEPGKEKRASAEALEEQPS